MSFVNELVNFFDPIINPLPVEFTEQMKEQAIEAVKSAYHEQQSEGKKIYMNIHISSPQVIIPQNSRSLNGFLVDLGNFNLSNRFVEIPVVTATKAPNSMLTVPGVGGNSSNALTNSVIDQIQFSLDNLEIKRVVFERSAR